MHRRPLRRHTDHRLRGRGRRRDASGAGGRHAHHVGRGDPDPRRRGPGRHQRPGSILAGPARPRHVHGHRHGQDELRPPGRDPRRQRHHPDLRGGRHRLAGGRYGGDPRLAAVVRRRDARGDGRFLRQPDGAAHPRQRRRQRPLGHDPRPDLRPPGGGRCFQRDALPAALCQPDARLRHPLGSAHGRARPLPVHRRRQGHAQERRVQEARPDHLGTAGRHYESHRPLPVPLPPPAQRRPRPVRRRGQPDGLRLTLRHRGLRRPR